MTYTHRYTVLISMIWLILLLVLLAFGLDHYIKDLLVNSHCLMIEIAPISVSYYNSHCHASCVCHLIATFNVQSINIFIDPVIAKMKITCYFALNSFADGCHVILYSEDDQSISFQYNITKPQYENTAVLYVTATSGNYTISVHDIIGGQIISDAAYTMEYYCIHQSTGSAFCVVTCHVFNSSLNSDVQFSHNQSTVYINETTSPSESSTMISTVGSSSLRNSNDNLKQLVTCICFEISHYRPLLDIIIAVVSVIAVVVVLISLSIVFTITALYYAKQKDSFGLKKSTQGK